MTGDSDDCDAASVLENELIMLESIYPGEFVFACGSFKMTVHPATCGDSNQQNISLLLELKFPLDYPSCSPIIRFHQPRGLSDFQLIGLMKDLHAEADKRQGEAIIFHVVDVLREFLTRSNFPSVECPFCLSEIEEGDEFFKTECYHYCHLYCLRRYVDYVKKGGNVVQNCVVCRMEFGSPVALERSAGLIEPKSLAATPSNLSPTGSELQRRQDVEWRRQKFELQKSKRGLIEPEPAEKVLTLNHIPEVDRLLQQSQTPRCTEITSISGNNGSSNNKRISPRKPPVVISAECDSESTPDTKVVFHERSTYSRENRLQHLLPRLSSTPECEEAQHQPTASSVFRAALSHGLLSIISALMILCCYWSTFKTTTTTHASPPPLSLRSRRHDRCKSFASCLESVYLVMVFCVLTLNVFIAIFINYSLEVEQANQSVVDTTSASTDRAIIIAGRTHLHNIITTALGQRQTTTLPTTQFTSAVNQDYSD
ncbi:putative E3 ubiquitin-protein ligase RNF25 [Hypsibius exemplaris]|uniref:E3 ubiquitin-protein ligase RNF25 n=1 Tax=Hypsibius exemplaris TaxID=2072580 RepID=A0A9X6RK84_HYPEX|nr:putative E3 ubiquitin-protein ligase RNF25 [Hypsibius exemplaris]